MPPHQEEHSHQHSGSCNHNHDHDHNHHHGPGLHVHPITKNMTIAFGINALFTVIEIVGGLWTNSIAILSDAVHDLGDTIALGASIWMEKISHKEKDEKFSFGYRRFSTLAALITSSILLVGSGFIIAHAIPRLLNPQAVESSGMLGLAVLGVIFNGLAVLRLKSGGDSLNNKALMLHLMEDALGWVAVLFGSAIMYFTNWYWIDPLLSLGIATFIIFNATKNVWSVMQVFLQRVPQGVDLEKIEADLKEVEGVQSVHDLHAWSLDGEYKIMTAHLVVAQKMNGDQLRAIKDKALHKIKHHNIQHPTLAIEFEGEHCHLEY